MRVLVAQTIFLGDLVLTTPLLQHLRHAYPEATLDVLVAKGMEGLLADHPAVSSVVTYDKEGTDKGLLGIWRLARRLKRRNYSLSLILPGSIRTAIAVCLARIPRRIGTNFSSGLLMFEKIVKFPNELRSSPHGRYVMLAERVWSRVGGKDSFISACFTDVVQLSPERDAIHRHLQLLSPLGIPIEHTLVYPSLTPSEGDLIFVEQFLTPVRNKKLIALAPGSAWATKRWPLERYQAVAKELARLSYHVVLVGGLSDAGIASDIVRSVQSNLVLNACGRFTASQSAALLKRCSVLVTNDSAPMHLASAVGTPCVAIFGPTIPGFGFSPVGENHVILERTSLLCRPCTPHGGERCPITTHECMTGISVDEVIRRVTHLID